MKQTTALDEIDEKINFLEKYLLGYYNVMLPYCYEFGGIMTSKYQLHDFEYAWRGRNNSAYDIFSRNYVEIYYLGKDKKTVHVSHGGTGLINSIRNPIYAREYSMHYQVAYNFSEPKYFPVDMDLSHHKAPTGLNEMHNPLRKLTEKLNLLIE